MKSPATRVSPCLEQHAKRQESNSTNTALHSNSHRPEPHLETGRFVPFFATCWVTWAPCLTPKTGQIPLKGVVSTYHGLVREVLIRSHLSKPSSSRTPCITLSLSVHCRRRCRHRRAAGTRVTWLGRHGDKRTTKGRNMEPQHISTTGATRSSGCSWILQWSRILSSLTRA